MSKEIDYEIVNNLTEIDQEIKRRKIEELKERIVGWDDNGNPVAAAPPDIPMIIEKVNEIIRYINDREKANL